MLWILAVEDDICEDIHGLSEVLFGDGGIEGGVFLVCEGIEFSTHTLQGIDDLQGMAFLRPFEGHVFAEMRHTLLARLFITGSGSDLIATIDHLRCRWQMNDT